MTRGEGENSCSEDPGYGHDRFSPSGITSGFVGVSMDPHRSMSSLFYPLPAKLEWVLTCRIRLSGHKSMICGLPEHLPRERCPSWLFLASGSRVKAGARGDRSLRTRYRLPSYQHPMRPRSVLGTDMNGGEVPRTGIPRSSREPSRPRRVPGSHAGPST